MGIKSGSESNVYSDSDKSGEESRILQQTLSTKTEASKNNIPVDIDIEIIRYKYYVDEFSSYADEKKEHRLASFDPTQMLQTVDHLETSLAMLKLENHVLWLFLENNEPKLLDAAKKNQISFNQTRTSTVNNSLKSTRYSTTMRSISLTPNVDRGTKKLLDYNINFKIKAELAEKTKSDLEKQIVEIEKCSSKEIKLLCAKIEEMLFRNDETIEAKNNFRLHFLRDDFDLEFLDSATEKQIERKLRKFMQNWVKSARTLLSSMRLTITSVQDNCQQLRNELLVKSDLSGILTYIDFEILLNKRNELQKSLEEKNVHLSGLKTVTGKASLILTEEKQAMQNLERKMRTIHSKSEEVNQQIIKLQKEADIVKLRKLKERSAFENLKNDLVKYHAPNVNDYIMKKEELVSLDKEEKMLKRKINILNMKLNNVLRKVKKRIEL